jgi:hypothetical protein
MQNMVNDQYFSTAEWNTGIDAINNLLNNLWSDIYLYNPPTRDYSFDGDDIINSSYTETQRIEKIERIFKLRAETQARRGELIERALVKRVWAKLYAVDTAELHPLGEKISADLAALFGSDDNEAKLKAKQLVDRHVFNALQHIKRLMDDFLVKVGEEEI